MAHALPVAVRSCKRQEEEGRPRRPGWRVLAAWPGDPPASSSLSCDQENKRTLTFLCRLWFSRPCLSVPGNHRLHPAQFRGAAVARFPSATEGTTTRRPGRRARPAAGTQGRDGRRGMLKHRGQRVPRGPSPCSGHPWGHPGVCPSCQFSSTFPCVSVRHHQKANKNKNEPFSCPSESERVDCTRGGPADSGGDAILFKSTGHFGPRPRQGRGESAETARVCPGHRLTVFPCQPRSPPKAFPAHAELQMYTIHSRRISRKQRF